MGTLSSQLHHVGSRVSEEQAVLLKASARPCPGRGPGLRAVEPCCAALGGFSAQEGDDRARGTTPVLCPRSASNRIVRMGENARPVTSGAKEFAGSSESDPIR